MQFQTLVGNWYILWTSLSNQKLQRNWRKSLGVVWNSNVN